MYIKYLKNELISSSHILPTFQHLRAYQKSIPMLMELACLTWCPNDLVVTGAGPSRVPAGGVGVCWYSTGCECGASSLVDFGVVVGLTVIELF